MSHAHHQAVLDAASFDAIAELAYREIGLSLVREKSSMIQSRLRHRLNDLNLDDFASYCDIVQSENGEDERKRLISALTTNVSHFFREKYHFDALAEILRARTDGLRAGDRLRIWSAGCSNGQETLSIAMTILECFPDACDHDIRVLGTDIDANVISFARRGIYPERMVAGISEGLLAKYFTRSEDRDGDIRFTAGAALKTLIQFNELNLLASWPMKRKFDVIFCKNVVIYFDALVQTALWPRFSNVLKPNGLLFLGHSERIAEPYEFGFQCVDQTTYRPLIF